MQLTDYHIQVLNAEICPYCKSKTKTVTEIDVYGREFRGRNIIACDNFPDCDSYVGTHNDGTPLGRLANKTLRNAKSNAHFWFDKIWKQKFKKRGFLYAELSDYLNIPSEYCHIGMFSLKTCEKTKNWSEEKYRNYIKTN